MPYAHKQVEDWPRQVKWPIPDADRIYGKMTAFRGKCRPAGCQVLDGKFEVLLLSVEQSVIVRIINGSIRKWAKAHAPAGFGWTRLDVNYHTEGEWVEDANARGPSIYGELGEHLSGRFESRGMRPTALHDEMTLFEGDAEYSVAASWGGKRINFVASNMN